MKKVLYFVFIFCTMVSMQCRKKTEQGELPPATQEGKNTFGMLLDGKPWMPKGSAGGVGSLSVVVENGGNGKGVFGISAQRLFSDTDQTFLGLGMRDSLFTLTPPFTVSLTNLGLFRVHYITEDCSTRSIDTDTQVSGNLTISKFDKTNGIISGTFNVTLTKYGCKPVSVTEGRFDMKF